MRNCIVTAVLVLGIPVFSLAQVEVKETANATMAASAGATAIQPTPATTFFQQSNSTPIQALSAGASKESKRKGQQKTPSEHANLPNATLELSSLREENIIEGPERAVFQRTPVQIVLRAGKERILHFRNPVTLSVPDDMLPLLGQPDIIDNSVYLTASQPFSRMRIVAQDLVTGQFIPLDVQASKDAVASHELDIVTPTEKTSNSLASTDKDAEADAAPDMVMLTRYAAHMVYAPRRLMVPMVGVRQVKVITKPVTGLYRGAFLETTPIGAWRSRDLYVTAVKVVNLGKRPVELDLSELRGQWIAATAQHGTVATAGSDDDTTVVYLISERPFEESR